MNVSVIRREITHILSISGWFLIVIVFKKETCASRESKQKNEVLPHHLLSEKFKEFYSTPRNARAGSLSRRTKFFRTISSRKSLKNFIRLQEMREPGVEPGQLRWQRNILPLNYPRVIKIGKMSYLRFLCQCFICIFKNKACLCDSCGIFMKRGGFCSH